MVVIVFIVIKMQFYMESKASDGEKKREKKNYQMRYLPCSSIFSAPVLLFLVDCLAATSIRCQLKWSTLNFFRLWF